MKTVNEVPGTGELRAAATVPSPPLTLVEEHALLLEQVAIRAEDVLTSAAGNRWPTEELQRLLGYIRAEVMRQAGDEEMLLFTSRGTSPALARLSRDHARLRDATEMLERAAAGQGTWSLTRVATVTRDLVCQLERHLAAEERVLTACGAQGRDQSVSRLGGHRHEWYPLTEGPVVDLDALPPAQVIDAVTDRLLRLGRGEHVELSSGSDPWLTWRHMEEVRPGGYGFTYLQDGPDLWRVQVTRRPDASDTR